LPTLTVECGVEDEHVRRAGNGIGDGLNGGSGLRDQFPGHHSEAGELDCLFQVGSATGLDEEEFGFVLERLAVVAEEGIPQALHRI